MTSLPSAETEAARRTALVPLLGGVLGAALAEGAVAGWAAAAEGGGFLGALVAGLLGFGLLAGLGAVVAVFAGLLADRRFVRRVGDALSTALGGPSPSPTVVLLLALFTLGAPVLPALVLGEQIVAGLSPKFAAVALAFATLLALVGALLGAALVGPLLSRLLGRLGARWPRVSRLPGATLVLATAGLGLGALLATRLSVGHGALPAGLLVGLALGLRPVVRLRRALLVTVAVVLVSAPAFFLGELSPPVSQAAVLYRAPYVSLLLGASHRLVDRDGDGHSPILMGGDCDDTKKNVHADAPEVPGNNLDENCSGADAKPYKPVVAPRVPRPATLPQKTNLLVILVDALRPDRMSHAGYGRATTPRLDRFRETATLFQNAYTSAPNTRLAMASMLTGMYAHRVPMSEGKGTTTLEPGAQTIAERLSTSGYARTAYTITYVMNRFRGYEQGWEKWDAPWGKKDWSWEWTRAAPLTSDAGIQFLKGIPEDRSKPYLLFLHYRCTHDPYYKHEIDFGDSDSDKYDSALNHCDTHIGRVLDAVEARADNKETAVVLLSDHGELFGEHGHTSHGETLSEPDARIAFLWRVPGALARTVERPVSMVDVAPTLMELAGLAVPNGLDGWSLVPELFAADGNPPRPERPLFFRTDMVRGSVRYNAAAALEFPHKLTRDVRTRRTELYDVVSDPAEVNNLAAAERERATALAEKLESWLGAGVKK